MSSALRAIWDNTYGLLVDDGQLAIGAIAALAITWLIAEYSSESVRENPHPLNTTPTRPYTRFSSPPQAGQGPGGPAPIF